jgi:hypothetical protein
MEVAADRGIRSVAVRRMTTEPSRRDRMRSAAVWSKSFAGLLFIFATLAASSAAASQRGDAFPMEGAKEGVETVRLIGVYRSPKWDTGRQGAATFTPPEGSELIVVRFDRAALAGKELAPNQVSLLRRGGEVAEPAPSNIYRVAFGATGAWTEKVFVVPIEAPLEAVVINGVRFSLEGVSIRQRPQ